MPAPLKKSVKCLSLAFILPGILLMAVGEGINFTGNPVGTLVIPFGALVFIAGLTALMFTFITYMLTDTQSGTDGTTETHRDPAR